LRHFVSSETLQESKRCIINPTENLATSHPSGVMLSAAAFQAERSISRVSGACRARDPSARLKNAVLRDDAESLGGQRFMR